MDDINKQYSLSEVGSIVSIDPSKIKDRVSPELIELLNDRPNGKIVGYRITDGTQIGLILELSNGKTVWFFQDEIKESIKTRSNQKSSKISLISRERGIKVNKEISYLVNPTNFINWLLYSIKDVQ
ncbi:MULTISPECIES: DUF2862 domain-containing protein [Prochlorococcus]|uniref:Uncharacterized protein n=1 Tax=Prochlorococcus marinus (strain SARG / CCMP1375 / SS120) TaxID=167539 RepID=Q7VCL8_PROMA|nr:MULTISPECIES: DUF2862 domain-containing protein [Prochlorococcus]AAP99766.1 Uncharacterized protein Pro_0722 [Prochlorococcus marinus subsp. marinus str. CCMP1375]KGG12758.1 hypothetical protein EV04_0702 [Prochlorococcus marinus str. LG]KGG22467.1 hypothetical protein EV08_0108 [Prochlorococcus marinus str. SS2]KGG23790.1 hypothetical protein EV09_0892 [Prochlorococcus marinus str. SS35]KGG31997.1 hypothetical protein EV10_1111 [Prochlorococcus marinus str. SS51]